MRCCFECMGARTIGLFLYRRTAYLFINESNITRYWIAQEFAGAHHCQSLPRAAPLLYANPPPCQKVAKAPGLPAASCALCSADCVCRMRWTPRAPLFSSFWGGTRALSRVTRRGTHHENQILERAACETKEKSHLWHCCCQMKNKAYRKSVVNLNILLVLLCYKA